MKDVCPASEDCDVEENSHSVPVLNRMISALKKTLYRKEKKAVLIRSQTVPVGCLVLATVFLQMSMLKTSELLIDGKRPDYRRDYTYGDCELLECLRMVRNGKRVKSITLDNAVAKESLYENKSSF